MELYKKGSIHIKYKKHDYFSAINCTVMLLTRKVSHIMKNYKKCNKTFLQKYISVFHVCGTLIMYVCISSQMQNSVQYFPLMLSCKSASLFKHLHLFFIRFIFTLILKKIMLITSNFSFVSLMDTFVLLQNVFITK